jgi:glycerol kinase
MPFHSAFASFYGIISSIDNTVCERSPSMPEALSLVIDQGTHATRTMLVDPMGRIRFSSFADIGLHRKGKLRVEQDPEEVLSSVQSTLDAALTGARRLGDVVCAGLAVQRSSVVAWDRHTGRAITPVISWLDRRALQWLKNLSGHSTVIKQRTGLPLSPHYGGSKLRWMAAHHPGARKAHHEGRLAWGPLGAFLLHHLLKASPYVVDHANAQRTQLWNLVSRNWDPMLQKLFEIPPDSLPETFPTCHNYGRLAAADVPVTAVTGDQAAAFFSLGRPRTGTVVINVGTGAFVLAPTGRRPVRHPSLLGGLVSSTSDKTLYAMEGTVNGAGAAFSRVAKEWQMPDLVLRMPELFRRPETPPIFLNTVGGLGSPWWRADIPPVFTETGTLAGRAVAVAESILFLIQANLDTLLSAGLSVSRLRMTGGISHLDALGQRMADLSGLEVYRPADTEATARGTAWLAFQRPRHWPKPGRGYIFKPRENPALWERYQQFCSIMEETLAHDRSH